MGENVNAFLLGQMVRRSLEAGDVAVATAINETEEEDGERE